MATNTNEDTEPHVQPSSLVVLRKEYGIRKDPASVGLCVPAFKPNAGMQTSQDFSKQLIKGKITEMIFEQMFRKSGKYTVIPFGYEVVVPELMQYANETREKGLLDTIRHAPDFALVSHDPTSVFLIEVKYRAHPSEKDIKKTVTRILEQWKLAHIFYATSDGFYFDKCSDLAKDGAKITPLSVEMVSKEIQGECLELLNDFVS